MYQSKEHWKNLGFNSYFIILALAYTSLSDAKIKEVIEALKIPVDQREIPIKSGSKSAAKISTLSSSSPYPSPSPYPSKSI